MKARILLKQFPELTSSHKYIFIDEVIKHQLNNMIDALLTRLYFAWGAQLQDTNIVQFDILKSLSGDEDKFGFFVGGKSARYFNTAYVSI